MKTAIKSALRKLAGAAGLMSRDELLGQLGALRRQVNDHRTADRKARDVATRPAQIMLSQHWRALAAGGKPLPKLTEVGFRCYSQFEEDGILLYLFSLIGTTNRIAVEVCAGDGLECNTTNLIVNHGWWGYQFDGNEENVARGRKFFAGHPDTFLHPPSFSHAWITAENINSVLEQAGLRGEVDLFSLDLDGMDYWVWKAIDIISPRVVVAETQNIMGPGQSLTVPYDPKFVSQDQNFMGASLAAMTRLARAKGYRLVGTHRYGFNAFYVRQGIGENLLPEVSVAACLQDPYSRSRAAQWSKVADRPWVEVKETP